MVYLIGLFIAIVLFIFGTPHFFKWINKKLNNNMGTINTCNTNNCSRLAKLVRKFETESFARGVKTKSLNCSNMECPIAIATNIYGFTVSKDGIVIDIMH